MSASHACEGLSAMGSAPDTLTAFQHMIDGLVSEVEEDIVRSLNRHTYQATRALGEFAISEQISDIVLIDRSARPVWAGLFSYYDLAHPTLPKPAIHFMNPEALESKGSHPKLRPVRERTTRFLARREMAATHNTLVNPSDTNMLVFDSCVHSGHSLRIVKNLLESLGHTDIKTAVFTYTPTQETCEAEPDFIYTDNWSVLGCRPYEKTSYLCKTTDSIYVASTHTPDQAYEIAENRTFFRNLMATEHQAAQERQW